MVALEEFAQESISPTQSAVDAYVQATAGGDADSAGFPWALAVGFVLVVVALIVVIARVRRLSR